MLCTSALKESSNYQILLDSIFIDKTLNLIRVRVNVLNLRFPPTYISYIILCVFDAVIY